MIEESYVRFDTARMLKEAGFEANLKTRYVEEEKDEWAFWESGTKRSDYNYFDDTIACPTQALAARWLREVHDTFVKMERVGSFDGKEFRFYWSFSIISVSTACLKSISGGRYDSYEEALEVGIAKCLERIIEEMKDDGHRA